jgi:hypothetical protein
LEEKTLALIRLKVAEKFTNKTEKKARYRFILGQLYEELGEDSAIYSYESVIDMNENRIENMLFKHKLKSAVV